MLRFFRTFLLAALLGGVVSCQSARTSMPVRKVNPAPHPPKSSPTALAKRDPSPPPASRTQSNPAPVERRPEPRASSPALAPVPASASVLPAQKSLEGAVAAATPPLASEVRVAASRASVAPAPALEKAGGPIQMRLESAGSPPRRPASHQVLALGAVEGNAVTDREAAPVAPSVSRQRNESWMADSPAEASPSSPGLDQALDAFRTVPPPAAASNSAPAGPSMDFNTNSPWF